MRTYFAEVLTRERARLADVRDNATLETWRQDLVAEIMTPGSPYLAALWEANEEASDRAEFLDQWRDLIARMIKQVSQCCGFDDGETATPHHRVESVDSEKTAVLILAALHGGVILTRLVRDSQPLNAALDLALGPLMTAEGTSVARTGPDRPVSNMDV